METSRTKIVEGVKCRNLKSTISLQVSEESVSVNPEKAGPENVVPENVDEPIILADGDEETDIGIDEVYNHLNQLL